MKGASSTDLDTLKGGLSGRISNKGILALLLFSLTAFAISPLLALLPVYLHNQDYSHGLLVPFVALLLAWRGRNSFLTASSGNRWGGGILLVIGCVLAVLGHWYAQALHPGYLGHVFLRGVGLLLVIWGTVWLLTGWRRTMILAPALGFLVFALPLPESFVLPATSRLQQFVSTGSAIVLRSLGFEVFREGNILQLPSLTLGVVEACSGIRSFGTFLATAFACVFFLRLTLCRTVLLLLFAPLAAIITNILRITITACLASACGPIWLEGTRHEMSGLATVVLGGVMILIVAMSLNQPFPHSPATGRSPTTGAYSFFTSFTATSLIISGLMLSAAGFMLYITLHYTHLARHQAMMPPAPPLHLSSFPRTLGPFQTLRDSSLMPVEFDILKPTDHIVRQYTDQSGALVELTILYWEPLRTYPGAPWIPRAPHSPAGCMQACGWEQASAFTETAQYDWLPQMPLSIWLFEKPGQKRLVLYWNQSDPDDLRLFAPRNLIMRLRLLINSWNALPEELLPENYGIKITLDAGNNLDATRKIAITLAREVARVLPQFGIRPHPK